MDTSLIDNLVEVYGFIWHLINFFPAIVFLASIALDSTISIRADLSIPAALGKLSLGGPHSKPHAKQPCMH